MFLHLGIGLLSTAAVIAVVTAWYHRPRYNFGVRRLLATVALIAAVVSALLYFFFVFYVAALKPQRSDAVGVLNAGAVGSLVAAICGIFGRGSERWASAAGVLEVCLWAITGLGWATV